MFEDRRDDATVDADAQHTIGLALRRNADEFVHEPLPEMFATLLARLYVAQTASAPSASPAPQAPPPPRP